MTDVTLLLFQSLTINVGAPTSTYVPVFRVRKIRKPLVTGDALLPLRQALELGHESAGIDDLDLPPLDARGQRAVGGDDFPTAALSHLLHDQLVGGTGASEDDAHPAEVPSEMVR